MKLAWTSLGRGEWEPWPRGWSLTGMKFFIISLPFLPYYVLCLTIWGGPLQSTYPSYIVLIFIPHLSCTRCCLRHQQEDSCSQGASGLIGSFDWVSREGLSEQLVISTEIYITGRSQPWDNCVDKHFRPREHLVARQGLSRNLWHCEFGWATSGGDSENVREGPDPGRKALWNWWRFFFSFPYCST